ncbi:3'-5' ssDNA/RNA exonuclease TatD-like isoform X2 [Hydractinia symbiolongicarpus]|nr:3'-5' ssDNA/RNA exonuclease TatD-like isoform X2 [Hydractinia symbiolongicarpus]
MEVGGKNMVIEEAKSALNEEKDIVRDVQIKGVVKGRRNKYSQKQHTAKNKSWLPTLPADQIFHLVDCGVNLTNVRFKTSPDYVIARALAAGVQKIIVTGLKLNGSKSAVVMAKTRPNILYAAVGVHPHFVKDDWTDNTLSQLEELIKLPEVVAVGEVGLDFFRGYSPRNIQETAFILQVKLAVRYQKPLLVVERASHTEVMNVLKEIKCLPPVIVFCFTGTPEEIITYVDKGFYIGVTGYVCKEKHGKALREAIMDGTLPLDRIIVHSNAPYMTPNSPREEIDAVSQSLLEHCYTDNEPCTLSIIIKCIAKCLSLKPREVADTCTATAIKVFRFLKF